MAYTDNKITTADLTDKGVEGLPDAPELSTEAMQKKFDEIAKDVIVPKFNELCETLDANVPPIIIPEAPITPQDGDMLVYDAELGAFVFVQRATTLANLKDVDLTGLVNGMYLRYDFPTRSWKATNSSASVPALDDINDVSIANATNGQCLIYNGGTWKNDNEKLDDLKNVYIHLPQNKQLLAYDAANDRWTNVELDGGGHKILNASGTQLAQEEYLQFGGLLKATDENGKTVVTDEAEEISFADWDALSEEQKDEYSAGKKLNILDPPDCDGEVAIENLHLAWTNDSPTSDYGLNQITLNIGDYGTYDKIRVEAHLGKNDNKCVTTEFDISDSGGSLRYAYTGATNVSVRRRDITNDGNNQITFGGAYFQVAGQTLSNDNAQLIPVRVYVYKNTATAKVNVLATNVKATVDYSTSEHKIGKWIDGSDLYEKTIDCGALPNNTAKQISHGISNLKLVVEMSGCMTNASNTLFYAIPHIGTNWVSVFANTSVVVVSSNHDASSLTQSWITLRYTKTS